jgi:hypothetical protein
VPAWCEAFVTAGYAHYCTLLPTAFVDEDSGVRQVAAMLGFLLGMESFALSLGCDRAQLELAVRQSHPTEPAKVALLWAAQTQVGQLDRGELRSRCHELIDNPMLVPAFPSYLSGFVHALDPVPGLSPFVVELLSRAFATLPDRVLLPWLPALLVTLRGQARELVPRLVREAARTFPADLAEIDAWAPPWAPARRASTPSPVAAGSVGPVAGLLSGYPSAGAAIATLLLGAPGDWRPVPAAAPPGRDRGGDRAGDPAVAALLSAYPVPLAAVATLVGTEREEPG